MSAHTASQLPGSFTLQPGNSFSQYRQPGAMDHSEHRSGRLPGYCCTSQDCDPVALLVSLVNCMRHSHTGRVWLDKCTQAALVSTTLPTGPTVRSSAPPKQSTSSMH